MLLGCPLSKMAGPSADPMNLDECDPDMHHRAFFSFEPSLLLADLGNIVSLLLLLRCTSSAMAPVLCAQVWTCAACRPWTTAYLAFTSWRGELESREPAAAIVSTWTHQQCSGCLP